MLGYSNMSLVARFKARNCQRPSEAWAMLATEPVDSEYARELALWLHEFGFRIPIRFALVLGVTPHPARPKGYRGTDRRRKNA